MEQIRELASQLGDAVVRHARYDAYRKSREAFQGDEQAQQLQRDYDAASELLQRKSALGQPIEPEEKRSEASLRESVIKNPILMELLRAQADFHELMTEINKSIEAKLELTAPPSATE